MAEIAAHTRRAVEGPVGGVPAAFLGRKARETRRLDRRRRDRFAERKAARRPARRIGRPFGRADAKPGHYTEVRSGAFRDWGACRAAGGVIRSRRAGRRPIAGRSPDARRPIADGTAIAPDAHVARREQLPCSRASRTPRGTAPCRAARAPAVQLDRASRARREMRHDAAAIRGEPPRRARHDEPPASARSPRGARRNETPLVARQRHAPTTTRFRMCSLRWKKCSAPGITTTGSSCGRAQS
ncbi:Uncharacterised protein [Burkholderia oklahomensis]|nr:hypothetical protein BG90_1180 [Burkholderia oklahomensis C6786]SUW59402.1 Uncharacterised protein [Burkholderia oklahomensis]